MKAQIQFILQDKQCTIKCSGTWDAFKINNPINYLKECDVSQFNKKYNIIYISGSEINKLDSAGGILLIEFKKKLMRIKDDYMRIH